jgi:hypothetical protein
MKGTIMKTMKKVLTFTLLLLTLFCSAQAQTYTVGCFDIGNLQTTAVTPGTNYIASFQYTNETKDVYTLLALSTRIALEANTATNTWTLWFTRYGSTNVYRLGSLAADVAGSESTKSVTIAPPIRYGDKLELRGSGGAIAASNTTLLATVYKLR